MTGGSQNKFLTAELDPALLSSPYQIQTNWHVITGASCSGKSTLVNQLAAEGFKTRPEAARIYFEGEFAKGRTIDEIRADMAECTRTILNLWLELNKSLLPEEITFLDRGLPDAPAFYRLAGVNPNEVLPVCFKHCYASVFVLDRLPYQKDDVRAGDDEIAEYFESWLLSDYAAMGYEVIRVPVLPPEERLEFVLEKLSELGLL